MSKIPTEFKGVTAQTKANVYFEGRVVSHTLLFPDGTKKTLGLIFPGRYHFGTDKAERMELVAGQCTVANRMEQRRHSLTARVRALRSLPSLVSRFRLLPASVSIFARTSEHYGNNMPATLVVHSPRLLE